MNYDLFYNESLQDHSEINLLDEDSINQMIIPMYRSEINKEEVKGDYSYQINKTKPVISNLTNQFQKQVSADIDIVKHIFCPKKEEEIKSDEINNDLFYLTNNKKLNNSNLNKKRRNVVLLVNHSDKGHKKFISKKYNAKNGDDKNEDITMNSSLPNEKMEEKCLFQVKETIFDKNSEKTEKVLNNNKVDKKITKLILPKRGLYKKRKLESKSINFNDKCFPFKTGKGVTNLTTKYNYSSNDPVISDNIDSTLHETLDNNKIDKANEESSNLNINDKSSAISNSENDIYLMKFVTKKYYYSENGRRKRVKKKRKYKADIIRKKIKSRFHKTIKTIINDNLKKAGSKMLFDCLPQCFIGNITKSLNFKCFDYTYKDLITTDFSSELNKYKYSAIDNTKSIKNLKVLKYLENNPEISKNSGFDIIKNMKYRDILNKYFISSEFDDSLNQLKAENETQEYIQSYIYTAKNYINFYNNYHFGSIKNINNLFEEKEDKFEEEINFDKDQIYLFKEDYNCFFID
jgi:hypothetical protein